MLEKGNRANTLHGILLIVLFSFAAFYIAGFSFVRELSLSPLIIGIILGMLYANSLRNKLPETWVPGIKFCSKQVLRWGIILYGFRLTLSQVAAVGLPAIAVDLIVVTVGLNQEIEREGLDREDLLLPASQRALLDGLLAQTDVPVVLTLLSGGGSVDISVYEQNEHVVGVLAVGYGGMFGGQAIAEVIVGDVNPSREREGA